MAKKLTFKKPLAKPATSLTQGKPITANLTKPKPDPTSAMAQAAKLLTDNTQNSAASSQLDMDEELISFKDKLAQMEALIATPDVPIEEFREGFILLKRHLMDVPQLGAELDEKEIGVISGAAWTLVDKDQLAAAKPKSKSKKPAKPPRFAPNFKAPPAGSKDLLDIGDLF